MRNASANSVHYHLSLHILSKNLKASIVCVCVCARVWDFHLIRYKTFHTGFSLPLFAKHCPSE